VPSKKKQKTLYSGRLRSRGGASVKKRYTRVVSNMRKTHKCPSCARLAVKRVSVGIWSCNKCGHLFAGGAYQPTTRTGQASYRIRQPLHTR
jgi:large subunit ribosomal protein L37Ae